LATLVLVLLSIVSRTPAYALGPTSGWTPPETILDFDNNLAPSVFSATVIDSGPILFFSHQDSGDSNQPLQSVERIAGAWQTQTVFDASQFAPPRFVQAVNLGGSPAVGVGFRNGSVRILSRTLGTWQQLFSDPQVDGLSDFEEHMGLTVVNGRLVGAYPDDIFRRSVTVVEQTAAGWTSTPNVLHMGGGLDLVSATKIDGKPVVFGNGISAPAQIGEKNAGGQWISRDGPSLTLAKVASWQNRPAAAGWREYGGSGDIVFSYRDSAGAWQNETVRTGLHMRSVDIDVINGRPYVAYFDVGANVGVHVARRLDDGTWINEQVSTSGGNVYQNAIDLFQYNSRPGVAWLDEATSSINISYNVPEPAAHLIAISMFTLCAYPGGPCKRRV
jgi:hypothetical protein